MTEQRKFGVRIPNGFHGSEPETIKALFDMAAHTIETNKLYYGFTLDLNRSALGEWRLSLVPKDKHEKE